MNIRTTLITSSLIAASLVSGAAHAALEGRDLNGSIGSFEAYYDTDLDITWLANANNGQRNWADANTWAANLSFTDGVNVYDNWRLPTARNQDGTGPCFGTNFSHGCAGSEMGHLFYSELGGTAGKSILTSTDTDLAKFTNLQANYYWSATESAFSTSYAWDFSFHLGSQAGSIKSSGLDVLAVSPGDVGAVPEAESWAMLLAGLGLVGAATRRRRG